ncbi:MAG: GTPase HflX, partial [Deltaproteobacteria bacterium]
MADKEKAYLVGIQRPTESRPQAERSFLELVELTRTAGGEIVGQTFQNIKQIDPTYFIGSGKVQEIARFVEEKTVDLVIVDDDLSPAQQAHLENKIGIRIVDRTGLILDIFAQRARSRAGKLQVERAQMIYLLPRLKGHGVLMSRLGGGIGTR